MGLDMFLSRKTVFTPMKDNIGIEKEEVVKEKQKHLGGLSGFGIYFILLISFCEFILNMVVYINIFS